MLEPSLTRLPCPLMVPEPLNRKLLVLELTVTTPGETVLVTTALVATPTVSSNRTQSLVVNTVFWLLARLIQLDEIPVSQTPLLALALHFKVMGVNWNNLAC